MEIEKIECEVIDRILQQNAATLDCLKRACMKNRLKDVIIVMLATALLISIMIILSNN